MPAKAYDVVLRVDSTTLPAVLDQLAAMSGSIRDMLQDIFDQHTPADENEDGEAGVKDTKEIPVAGVSVEAMKTILFFIKGRLASSNCALPSASASASAFMLRRAYG